MAASPAGNHLISESNTLLFTTSTVCRWLYTSPSSGCMIWVYAFKNPLLKKLLVFSRRLKSTIFFKSQTLEKMLVRLNCPPSVGRTAWVFYPKQKRKPKTIGLPRYTSSLTMVGFVLEAISGVFCFCHLAVQVAFFFANNARPLVVIEGVVNLSILGGSNNANQWWFCGISLLIF